ncbi:MAG: ATP-binding protein, partial [Caldilineaceae bacterium]|nr:ATP-binding protein [Caldilineaceae bacterium]
AIIIDEEMPTFRAERIPLELTLRNLIGNAVKHHHRAEGKIKVTAKDQGEFIEFTISDDGPGIAQEYHDRIFGMFQTLRSRDEVEGSGLGLAIVKKTIESRGGIIAVESQLGKGATFRFTWPKEEKGELYRGE